LNFEGLQEDGGGLEKSALRKNASGPRKIRKGRKDDGSYGEGRTKYGVLLSTMNTKLGKALKEGRGTTESYA